MATTVQLQLTLDASGAVTGVTQLGEQIKKLSPPPSSVQKGFGEVEDQVKRAQQAIQGLSKITGIEVPAALEEVMSKSKMLGPMLAEAFGVITGGEIGLAIVQIGIQAYEAFGKISDQMMGLTDKVKKNNEELAKNNMDRYLHPASLAQTNKNLGEIISTTQRLRDKQEEYAKATEEVVDNTGEALPGIVAAAMIRDQEVVSLEKQQEIDAQMAEGEEHRAAVYKELHEAQVLGNQAGLKGLALIEQQHQDNKKLIEDQITLRSYKQADFVKSETAAAMRNSEDARYNAEKLEFERQSAESTIALRHQVMESSVQGIAKIRQIESDAQEDLERRRSQGLIKDEDAKAQRVLIAKRAAEQERQAYLQLDASQRDAELFGRQRAASFLQGSTKIRESAEIEKQQIINDLQQVEDKYGDTSNEAQQAWINKNIKIAAIDEATNRQLELHHRQLTDKLKDMQDEAAIAGLPEGARAQAQIRQEHEKTYRDLNRLEVEDWENFADYEDQKVAADQLMNAKLAEQHKHLVDQLKDMQYQAAIASLPAWERSEAQIRQEHEKTIRELNELQAADLDNWQVYEDQKAAADKLMNAKLIDEHKRMTEQLGSDLESVFDDMTSGKIGERILKNIKKFFFQMIAAWLQATGFMKTIWGQLFGTLIGGPGSSLEQSSGGGLGSILGLFSSSKATAPATSAGTATGASSSNLLAGILGFGPQSTSSGASGWPGVPWALPGGTSAAGAAAGLGVSAAGAAGGAVGAGLANVGLGSVNLLGGFEAATGLTLKKSSSNAATAFTKQDGAALAALGLSLGGGLVGGKIGQVGGMIASLGVMALASPGGVAAKLLSHLGVASSTAAMAAAEVGSVLMAFGLGSNTGKLAGTLGGAGIGFGTGLALMLAGGPIGWLGALGLAAISALAGLFGGIFGGKKRRRQANAFANDTVLPAVHQIEDQYKNFSLDHASAISQLEDLRKQAQDNLGKLKGEGRDVMKNVVGPAIDHAEADINGFEAERQRRAALTFGPPEFHTGGFVDTMTRSFTSRPGDLLAVLKRGEFVVNPAATAKNRRTLEAINSGGSAALSVGEIHIHPATLDRAYVRTGFKQDLLDALSSLRKEGRL